MVSGSSFSKCSMRLQSRSVLSLRSCSFCSWISRFFLFSNWRISSSILVIFSALVFAICQIQRSLSRKHSFQFLPQKEGILWGYATWQAMPRYIPRPACWWLPPPSPRKERRICAAPFKPPSASAVTRRERKMSSRILLAVTIFLFFRHAQHPLHIVFGREQFYYPRIKV